MADTGYKLVEKMKKVMAFGTFDILHPGHIYFLQKAKSMGDFLIVSLARDNYIKQIKKHRAIHSEAERKKLLSSLKFVDKVVFGGKGDHLAHIVKEKPDVIALGYDQKHFTSGLQKKLAGKGLKVKIARIKPYKQRLYKSSKILSKI